ncbi:TPA: group II intron reverse transcriptase/maturase [Bacillus cereus]
MANSIEDISRPLKRQKLRNNEYYNIQDTFDELYEKSRNGKKFTNLLSIITDPRNIHLAFRNIKRNQGSTTIGTDGLTIERWAEATNEEYVEYVTHRLENYLPQMVRRVHIPKSNGKLRPLGIPTIGDRLVQQCIKQVLEPICEAKFHKHSYGFRPNRSTKHAIAKVYHSINLSRTYHVVDIDIKGFFDNVNHGKLLKQLWTLGIRDKSLLSILSKMLKAEIEGEGVPTKGTPQGGILSPLLSNVVLNELDWWISDQWESFETQHTYSRTNGGDSKKYRALRKSGLKEMYLVRYADDFKIMCKSKKDAERIMIACTNWLRERLSLETSPDKSRITDLRHKKTEFLGISIGLQPAKKNGKKNTKYVVKSHISTKAEKQIITKLREHIKNVRDNTTAEAVMKYNSAVLGIQNYYKCATHVNLDANRLAFTLNKILHNRLKTVRSERGTPSKTYLRIYKNNYKRWYIANIGLYPLGDVQHEQVMMYSEKVNSFTEEGRQYIHRKLNKKYDHTILRYIMENPVRGMSVEYNDNRISLYVGQYGKCGVSGLPLEIGEMEVHHKIPRKDGGTDEYKNLIYVRKEIHKLIHATHEDIIKKYLGILNLDAKNLGKLNKLRRLVGNIEI